jgi:uncharacterized protein YjbI with pentapeptide repeats
LTDPSVVGLSVDGLSDFQYLTDCLLTDCMLTDCLLTDCVLTDCVLTDCLLTDCLLTDCLLTDCLLTDCLLTDCLLTDCLLTDCLLTDCGSTKYFPACIKVYCRKQRISQKCYNKSNHKCTIQNEMKCFDKKDFPVWSFLLGVVNI